MSARVEFRLSPNRAAKSENTRSHPAEFGEQAKTLRAADAQALKLEPCAFQKLRTWRVNSSTEWCSTFHPAAAALYWGNWLFRSRLWNVIKEVELVEVVHPRSVHIRGETGIKRLE